MSAGEDIEMNGLTDGNIDGRKLKKHNVENMWYLKLGEREEHSEGVSENVIVNCDPPIKTNSYSHRGHDSVFVP